MADQDVTGADRVELVLAQHDPRDPLDDARRAADPLHLSGDLALPAVELLGEAPVHEVGEGELALGRGSDPGRRTEVVRALALGTPLGLLLGVSKAFNKSFDPIIQILRPVSPLAWLPLGLVLFQKPEPAGIFTIAMCAMWPTVLNTALGVRSIPQDYLNVARVLRLSRTKLLFKIMLPAALPYMFTGFRLSLGIAWLVIVAAEMLTGAPGVGGFLWQEYNSLIYEHLILCIVTIGLVGFLLDRLMGVVEARLKTA